MNRTTLSALFSAGLMLTASRAAADPPIIDPHGVPANLKKFDPPPRSLHVHEPPPPERQRPADAVNSSSDTAKSSPSNGTLQGPNSSTPVKSSSSTATSPSPSPAPAPVFRTLPIPVVR